LKSELELYLATEYRRVRIIPHPEGENTFTVTGELQNYPGKVRIICRITKPDGSLGGGKRIDIPSSPELMALLEPTALPPPETMEGDRILEDLDPALEDPFEPDDAPGFEVQIPPFGTQGFGRTITPGDVDRFRFYKSEKGTIVLEARTNIDLQLLLFREGENIPFEVSGSESFGSSEAGNLHATSPAAANLRLETTLEEGYYVVELLAYDFNVQGPYEFSVDLTGKSNDSFEPDNRFEDAKVIYPDTTQDRALLSGDQDWVELSFTVPAFYSVYTTGRQVDTIISLFTDEQREILADDNSGSAENASIPLFLGTRRIYCHVSGQGSGDYTLVFQTIDPAQLFPAAGIQEAEIDENPLPYQLRIIQSGKYVIRSRGTDGARSTVSTQVFSLPSMRPIRGGDSTYSLTAGDYLLVLHSEQRQRARFCVAPESAAAECLRLIQE
jgi:hypothetical protein